MNWFAMLIHWIVSGLALAITALLVPGFRLRGFGTALVASLLIAALNFFLRPVLDFLAFPFTVLTLGFFVFVIDAIVLRLCAAFMKDFEISNWISAILGAVILALTSSFLHFIAI